MGKEKTGYLCGTCEVLSKLEVPEINDDLARQNDFVDFFDNIKNFLVSMKTKVSEKETVEKVKEALENKKFRPRLVSGYEKFLVKVFDLLNSRGGSKSFYERIEKVQSLCETYNKKGKDKERGKQIKNVGDHFAELLEIVRSNISSAPLKRYLCGTDEDLNKLEEPKISDRFVLNNSFGGFFDYVKKFLVSMKTKISGEETIKYVTDKLNKKQFKPLFEYEKFLVKVFDLLNNQNQLSTNEKLKQLISLLYKCSLKEGIEERRRKLVITMQNLSAFADAKQQKEMLKKNTLDEHILFSSTKAIEQMLNKDRNIVKSKTTVLKTDVSKIKTAIFGDHVKTIPVDAFNGAEKLEKISFGKASGFGKCKPNKSSKCKIGVGAFKNCKNLREIAFFPLIYNDEEAVRSAFDDDIANEIEKKRPKCSDDSITEKERIERIKKEYKKMKYNPCITIG